MKRILIAVLSVSFLALTVSAQDAVPELSKEQIMEKKKELGNQVREEKKKLSELSKKNDLHKDEEIAGLKKQIAELNKQLQEKIKAKLSEDPVGAACYKKIDELEAEMKKLKPARKPRVKKERKPKKDRKK